MRDSNDRNRMEWERRSRLSGSSLKGVLFKGLPTVVNEHLHNWQKAVVLNSIERKKELKILDVGCGYGRLSMPIIELFPEADIIGVDISENYARLYRENTNHPGLVGAVENLPAELGAFDYILCVTVLMYVDPESLGKAVLGLLLHLKPGGRLILIEPHCSGIPFQTGFGVLSLLMRAIRPDSVRTGGRVFGINEVGCLLSKVDGKILSETRLPITSVCFVPVILLGVLLPKRTAKGVFRIISRLDRLLGMFRLPSLYVAYIVAKN